MLPLARNPRAKMRGITDGFVKLFAARAPARSSAGSWSRRGPPS